MKKRVLWASLLILSSMSIKADEFIGIIKPIHDVKISVPLDGVIKKILLKEGSAVKQKQTILELKNYLQQLEVNRRKIIWKDRSKLNAALKNRKIQKSLLNSTRKLYNQTQSVSRDALQILESKYYILNGEIQMQRENEKKEKVEYQIARQLLSKYTVKSPIKGIVTEVSLQEGEWAKAGKPFIRVVNADVCYIDINIDEAYSSQLKVGNNIDFTVKTKSIMANKKGKVTFISPVADMASGLVRVKIEFSNIKNRIIPGLSATININNLSKNSKESK